MAKKNDIELETTSAPVNDAWTGMLIVSFLALGVGTGFLVWDYLQYSDTDLPKPSSRTVPAMIQPGKKDVAVPVPVPEEKKKDEPAKVEEKKEEKANEKKDEDKKEADKKGASLHNPNPLYFEPLCSLDPGLITEAALSRRQGKA